MLEWIYHKTFTKEKSLWINPILTYMQILVNMVSTYLLTSVVLFKLYTIRECPCAASLLRLAVLTLQSCTNCAAVHRSAEAVAAGFPYTRQNAGRMFTTNTANTAANHTNWTVIHVKRLFNGCPGRFVQNDGLWICVLVMQNSIKCLRQNKYLVPRPCIICCGLASYR